MVSAPAPSAPDTETLTAVVEPLSDLYQVAPHIPEDHMLRVRIGSDPISGKDLDRRYRFKGQRIRALLNAGALVRV